MMAMDIFRTNMRRAYRGRINADENSAEKITLGIRRDIDRLKRQYGQVKDKLKKSEAEIERLYRTRRG
jgi:hypothetical protein